MNIFSNLLAAKSLRPVDCLGTNAQIAADDAVGGYGGAGVALLAALFFQLWIGMNVVTLVFGVMGIILLGYGVLRHYHSMGWLRKGGYIDSKGGADLTH